MPVRGSLRTRVAPSRLRASPSRAAIREAPGAAPDPQADAALRTLAGVEAHSPGALGSFIGRSDSAMRRSMLLQLQRTQGNDQVQRVVASASETEIVPLASPRFADSERLQRAHRNHPAMRSGDGDVDAVARVQQALIDLGFEMPVSTRKTGGPDGIYGAETRDTVKAFQRKYGLDPDGVVGHHSLDKLDELFGGPGPEPPKKKEPEIAATEEALGEHVKADVVKVNDPSSFGPASGVWYDYNYLAEHKAHPEQYPWSEDYRLGLADKKYWDRVGQWDWVLKPRVSASEGIKAWLNGLTIAECQTTLVAAELDTLRAAVGDDKFDARFGSNSKLVPASKRLRIAQGAKGSSLEGLMTYTEAAQKGDTGTFGHRPAKVGEWYYFYNHPKYLLKHPGGAFQGENSVYMGVNDAGEQTWEGLGSGLVTEEGMLDVMVQDYNRPRDDQDARALAAIRAANGGKVPAKYVLEANGGTEFHDDLGSGKSAREKILNEDRGYDKIDGTPRTGGFLASVGQRLDLSKVIEMRNA